MFKCAVQNVPILCDDNFWSMPIDNVQIAMSTPKA